MQSLLSSTNKRSEIVVSAIELFARKGYDGTTIRDISGAAGVTDGAMYRHFSGKEELARLILEALVVEYSDGMIKVLAEYPDAKQRIKGAVDLTYEFYKKYPSAMCFALKSQHNLWEAIDESIIHPHTMINRIIEEGLAAGEIKQGDLLTLGGLFAGALMEPMNFHFYLDEGSGDIGEMAVEVNKRIQMMLISKN